MTSGLDFASDSALFEPAANILCKHLVSRLLNTEAFMDTHTICRATGDLGMVQCTFPRNQGG